MKSNGGLGTVLVVLLACSPKQVESRAEAAATESRRQPEQDEQAPLPRDLTFERVSQQRALAMLAPVSRIELARAQLAERFADYLHRTVRPSFAEGQSQFLFHLGLIAKDLDLLQASVDLGAPNLAGFYDPTRKTLYVASDLRGPERQLALAHEFVHALQDQHFDVGSRIVPTAGHGDRLAALHGLAEGDATAGAEPDWRTWLEYAPPPDRLAFEASLLERHPEAPKILVAAIAAPYVDGVLFVRALLERGGWPAVNAAWAEPPGSTEQLLHPEKYFAHEGWLTLPPSAPPPGDCRLMYWDVLGEQALAMLLRQWSAAPEAATLGWNGDRLEVYQCNTGSQTLLRMAFDSPKDARRVHEELAAHFSCQMHRVALAAGDARVSLTAGEALDCQHAAAWLESNSVHTATDG